MSTSLIVLLNAVTVAGAGVAFSLTSDARYQGGDHTIEVSGTFVGTVDFEARIKSTGAWKSFASITGPDVVNVPGCFDAIRGNVTAYTSGSITMEVHHPLLQDLKTDLTTLTNRLSSARATLLDNLNRLDAAVSTVSSTSNINNLIKMLREHGKL